MDFFDKLEKKARADRVVKIVAGAIILNQEDKVLFLKRREDDFMGGILELPSGVVEKGEKINEGLEREVKEETNLDIDKLGMFINTFDYLSSSGKKSRQFTFEVNVEKSEDIFLTEHDEYKWLNYEEILENKNITDEVKYAIEIYRYNKSKVK